MTSLDEISECPECTSVHLVKDYKRAELVCGNCGLVITEQLIDEGPEWRAFDSEQNDERARTGAPASYLIHDKGLSTEIGWQNRDFYGRRLPHKNRAQVYRMRKWQHRTKVSNSTERNITVALNELNKLASKMGLPKSVKEAAAVIYRKAAAKSLIRGRSIETVMTASIYAACRQCDLPRSLNEIAAVSSMGKKEIGRTYRFLVRKLKISMTPTKPQNYVQRLCSELGLSGNTLTITNDILNKATEYELTSGRGPLGVAAASTYIASVLSGERRTQKEIAEAAGVTEVTIRNRYKELIRELDIDLNLNQ